MQIPRSLWAIYDGCEEAGKAGQRAHRLGRRLAASAVVAMSVVLSVPIYAAESVEFDASTGGPPAGPETTLPQVVTMRRNTDNPAGNTFAALANPLTVTFSYSNPRFPGLQQPRFGSTAFGVPPYGAITAAFNPQASDFTSTGVGAATGVGISTGANGVMFVVVSPQLLGDNAVAPGGTHDVVDLTLTFSRPVDNPVLHLVDVGGGNAGTGYSAEFNLISAGTLTELSGNGQLAVTATQINNASANPTGNGCQTANSGTGCGSVRVNALGVTTVSFTVSLRGFAGSPWPMTGALEAEGVGIGVSVDLPARLTIRTETTGGVGSFDYGGPGLAPQTITTVAPGVPVAGAPQAVPSGTALTVTQTATQINFGIQSISCVDGANAPVSYTADIAARNVTINASALASDVDVVCTFVNATPPPPVPVAAISVPSLGTWALLGLSGLLGAVGTLRSRRKG